jgi:hypothetical protein
LLLSVSVFTQALPQADWPLGQTQSPKTQVAAAGQTCPQAPQLLASLRGSTQLAPHLMVPVGQPLEQAPFAQVVPEGQTDPQAPQLLLSVRVFTQALPQTD